jgi:Putative Flp pilus-assembly TadE/G-like
MQPEVELRGQGGQTIVMVLCMLMIFTLIAAMVVNVGQAVNRRVALQLVADAGAYTGATSMAEGLNYMAFANRKIQELWPFFTYAWDAAAVLPPPGTCSALEGVVSTYNAARAPYAGAFEVINRIYSVWPYVEARRVSEQNVDQLFPTERGRGQFSFREVLGAPPDNPLEGVITPARDAFSLMDTQDVPDGTRPNSTFTPIFPFPTSNSNFTWWCWTCCIVLLPYLQPEQFQPGVWFERSSDETRYFVWRVRVDGTKALMFDKLFGPIPPMTAVAVAKPVGGSIIRGDPSYLAKLVPVSNVLAGGVIRDTNFTALGGIRQVTH